MSCQFHPFHPLLYNSFPPRIPFWSPTSLVSLFFHLKLFVSSPQSSSRGKDGREKVVVIGGDLDDRLYCNPSPRDVQAMNTITILPHNNHHNNIILN